MFIGYKCVSLFQSHSYGLGIDSQNRMTLETKKQPWPWPFRPALVVKSMHGRHIEVQFDDAPRNQGHVTLATIHGIVWNSTAPLAQSLGAGGGQASRGHVSRLSAVSVVSTSGGSRDPTPFLWTFSFGRFLGSPVSHGCFLCSPWFG